MTDFANLKARAELAGYLLEKHDPERFKRPYSVSKWGVSAWMKDLAEVGRWLERVTGSKIEAVRGSSV